MKDQSHATLSYQRTVLLEHEKLKQGKNNKEEQADYNNMIHLLDITRKKSGTQM